MMITNGNSNSNSSKSDRTTNQSTPVMLLGWGKNISDMGVNNNNEDKDCAEESIISINNSIVASLPDYKQFYKFKMKHDIEVLQEKQRMILQQQRQQQRQQRHNHHPTNIMYIGRYASCSCNSCC